MNKLVLKGGLGNQLFQIAYALKYEKELTVIDWCLARPALENGTYPPILDYKLPENFVYLERRTPIDRVFSPTYFARGVINHVFSGDYDLHNLSYLSRIKLFSYFKDLSLLSPQIRNKPEKSRIIAGYFQEIPNLTTSQLNVLREISLSKYSDEVLQLKKSAKEQNPIIVHMRIGDYAGSEDLGVLPAEYFERALEELARRVPNFDTFPIWLFSDSPEKAIEKFPKIYQEQMVLIPKGKLTTADTLEVMRSGNQFVISNSTFSWWAAFLSEAMDKNVIYPDPWFAKSPYSKKLFPKNWIPIRSGL